MKIPWKEWRKDGKGGRGKEEDKSKINGGVGWVGNETEQANLEIKKI